VCEGPEEQEGYGEWNREEGCYAVAGEVVGWVVRRGASGIADEGWDVYLNEGEVVEIEAPCPYALKECVSRWRKSRWKR
jgi:hypothetical protein